MAKDRSVFVCQQCQTEHSKWSGQCAQCGEWNTLVETVVSKSVVKFGERSRVNAGRALSLSEVKVQRGTRGRSESGMTEFDRVLGGGIVPGSVVLVAGEPGIGKSTLLTQLALNLSRGKGKVLYVCGEESPGQVKMRVERIEEGKKSGPGRPRIPGKNDDLLLLPETNVDIISSTIESISGESDLSLVVIDSIQSLTTGDLMGMAGSVGQVRESAQRLSKIGKRLKVPIFLVGHVTKQGSIAGPKVLEHLVDAVLELTGERTGAFRVLRAVKNRFGATDEVGVFEMADSGLAEVLNPSKAFLEESQQGTPGSVVVAVMEGTRPVLVEVQALVVSSQLAIPRRVTHGVSVRKVQLLSAVLQKRCRLGGLGTSDIFVNVAGGIHVVEPAADLGIALAIASSLMNRSLPKMTAVVGEVGLLGEIRKVAWLDKRIKEARKLGYSRIVSSKEYKSLSKVVKKFLG